jgi:Zn-dependent protease
VNILVSVVAMVMALFVAMPFHEFAHAFAAKREGDLTAVAYGRYTLAPLAHFDWKGFLFLFLFRFGWAKPVPVDERNFKRGRKSKFLVSIAGILTNLVLGTIFLFIYLLVLRFNASFFTSNLYGNLLYLFLSYSISLNFMLAFFNLLPIYPLDGYRIVESFSKTENAYLRFTKQYSFIIYLILAFSGLYYIYYSFTADLLIQGLTKLFMLILGF